MIMMLKNSLNIALVVVLSSAPIKAFQSQRSKQCTSHAMCMKEENKNFPFHGLLKKTIPTFLSIAFLSSNIRIASASEDIISSSWEPGLSYSIVKSGNGEQPIAGELVAIRFTGSYKGNVFDDTFKTDVPYLYRCGVGR